VKRKTAVSKKGQSLKSGNKQEEFGLVFSWEQNKQKLLAIDGKGRKKQSGMGKWVWVPGKGTQDKKGT